MEWETIIGLRMSIDNGFGYMYMSMHIERNYFYKINTLMWKIDNTSRFPLYFDLSDHRILSSSSLVTTAIEFQNLLLEYSIFIVDTSSSFWNDQDTLHGCGFNIRKRFRLWFVNTSVVGTSISSLSAVAFLLTTDDIHTFDFFQCYASFVM